MIKLTNLGRSLSSLKANPTPNLESPSTSTINADKKESIKLVSTPSVLPKRIFFGRNDTLNQIHSSFKEGERVIFLYGIGGIGKTQIVKQYAKQYKQNYDTIIYSTYNNNLKEMVISDVPFTFEPQLTRLITSDGTVEDDEAFYLRKINLIKKAANEKTLIILDNFDVEYDECLLDFIESNFHLLVTSRCDYSNHYKTITIPPIDSIEDLKEIFLQNYHGDDVDRNDPALIELIELVNRHTYTIELLALHMENSGQTPKEMIAALKTEGILSLNEAIRNADMKTQIAYENLLKMFKIFTLSEEEQSVLMHLSLMPLNGVNSKDFREWNNLKSAQIIRGLERRSWILKNIDGIALHPIIRDVIKHYFPPNETNCKTFLNNFTIAIDEKKSWHFNKAKKEQYASIALSILQTLPTINENNIELYKNTAILLSFAIKPQIAVELAEKIYHYFSYNSNTASFNTGWICYKLGWTYIFNVQLPNYIENAKKWLEKSYAILSCLDLNNENYNFSLQQVLINLSKVYLRIYEATKNIEDYNQAKNYAEVAIKKSEAWFQLKVLAPSNVAGAYLQLADVYIAIKDFKNAAPLIDKSYEILNSLYGENDSDTLFALSRKAAVLYGMEYYESAIELIKKTLEGYNTFYNSSFYFHGYELLLLQLKCYIALKKSKEAEATYIQVIKIAQNLFEPNSAQLKLLHEIFYC